MDKTDIKIDDAILEKTTKCNYAFSCLSGDKSCLCDVVDSNEEDIVEIKSTPILFCGYCRSLEHAVYCFCPTRAEIYNRYRI